MLRNLLQSGASDRAKSRYLTSAIMEARSWQELEGLARNYSAVFNHIQVSALVCRLPKVVRSPEHLPQPEKSQFNRFLREVSDLVTHRLSTFDPRAIANVLWAVSKLGYSPAPTTLNQFLFESYVRMHDFNAQELANLAWALANLTTMGNRPVPVWLRKYTLAAVPRVPELKPKELAHLTWALSKLFPGGVALPAATRLPQPGVAPGAAGTPPSSGVGNERPSATHAEGRTHAGAASAEAHIVIPRPPATAAPTAGEPSTSASADAAGPASSDSATPLRELVAALTFHAIELIPRFACGELVVSVWSLQNLDLAAGTRLLRPALQHLLRTTPQDLSAQDLAFLWQTMGKCAADSSAGGELLPPGGASGSNGPAGTSRASRLSCAGSTGAVAGAAAGRSRCQTAAVFSQSPDAAGASLEDPDARQPPLDRDQLHALLDLTVRSLYDFTAQGLCMTLWAWARLGLQPDEAVARAVFQRFHQVLPAQAAFQCVAISLWSAAQLRLRPPSATMALFETCARLQLPASKPLERQALLWALQRMRYRPSEALLESLNIRLLDTVDQLYPLELQWVLRAYDVFGVEVPRRVRLRALHVATQIAAASKRDHAAAVTGAGSAATSFGWGSLPAAASLPAAPAALGAPPAAAAATAHRSTATPCAAVSYFAALVGLGVDVTCERSRRRAAERKVQLLRWRLEASAQQRRALRASIEGSVQGRLGELDDGQLSALLAVLVRLHLRPRATFVREVYRELALRAATAPLLHRHAAALLAMLGRLNPRPRPPPEVLAGLLAALEPHLAALPDEHLLSTVQSLARLRYRPPGPWLRCYFAECMARVDGWPSANLEVFLSSLTALGLRLSGAPCRQLQVVVYRRKKRGEAAEDRRKRGVHADAKPGDALPAARKGAKGSKAKAGGAKAIAKSKAPQEMDLKRSLCTLCSELSGCAV
ncbi:hypothetical protein PLESTM_000801200 [Pleodorina starrii]|nr:hypothetical protein PLESTM_000801200 [Pleodorina starrii]